MFFVNSNEAPCDDAVTQEEESCQLLDASFLCARYIQNERLRKYIDVSVRNQIHAQLSDKTSFLSRN